MLCLPTKCNIDWRWFYTGETRQSAPEASASSAAARVCVCAQMCVLCARVLMSPRLFDGKGEWGGEGRPALARPPAALCLLSLCILWWVHLSPPLSLSDSLCFLFILLSFMFSPFLYMIARSKAARGTGLQCWCEDFAVPEIQLNSDTQNKRSRAAAVPVPPPPPADRSRAVFRWPFAHEQPSQSMFSFIFTYRNHGDERKRLQSRINVRLTSPASVVKLRIPETF